MNIPNFKEEWRFYLKWVLMGLLFASLWVYFNGKIEIKIDWKWFIGFIIAPLIVAITIVVLPRVLDYYKKRNLGQYCKEVKLKDSYPTKGKVMMGNQEFSFLLDKERWRAITKREYIYLKNECAIIKHLEFRRFKG